MVFQNQVFQVSRLQPCSDWISHYIRGIPTFWLEYPHCDWVYWPGRRPGQDIWTLDSEHRRDNWKPDGIPGSEILLQPSPTTSARPTASPRKCWYRHERGMFHSQIYFFSSPWIYLSILFFVSCLLKGCTTWSEILVRHIVVGSATLSARVSRRN